MRVETGETNLDLHVWEPTPTVTRLTTTTEDHAIVGIVMADDS